MTCVKRAVQAESLVDHLADLHNLCTDFVSENFQSYIGEYESHQEHEDEPDFDPFDLLHYHFDSGLITDLPKAIEQYSELLDLAHSFSDYRKKVDQGFNELFGDALIPHYLINNADGDEALIPRTDLSEDEQNELDANKEIEGISIEYCLDGYNAFYEQCLNLINSHRPEGTIRECAAAILLLYSAYAPTKNT